MSTTREFSRKTICQAILAVYGVTRLLGGHAAPTSIHNEPLGTAGGVPEKPNLMFILDGSGSMAFQYTPDYVETDLCRDAFEDDERNSSGTDRTLSHSTADGRDDNSALDQCQRGDPSWTSPNYNFQYYSPSITYTPGFDPALAAPPASPAHLQNSNMTNYNSAALWAAVENDPYPSNNPTGSINIINGNTDTVFCNTSNPTTAQMFNLALNVCKEPIDHSVSITGEAAGSGVWRYPNAPISLTTNAASPLNPTAHYAYRIIRTGDASNPLPPYFHTISQVLFCVNRNGSTAGTRPSHGNTPSKVFFGKGSLADNTDKCAERRFNDGTTNYRWPRFGLVPYSASADTQALNSQEGGTLATANRWAGMSGFRRHRIVETSAGSNTLPASYPSRADATVYGARLDCSGPCTYTQEMTNYANWWAYYRNRMLQMKTAAGQAFRTGLDDAVRVGFITINPGHPVGTVSGTTYVSANRFLPLRLFDSGHKTAWYAKFYAQDPGGGTPLREALSRVGRHFAGRTDRINSGMGFASDSLNEQGNPDAMTKSCQRNIALLTTDGYWTDVESAYDSAANTGWKLNGTTRMDDQDETQAGATVARPFYDGPGAPNSASAKSVGTLADVAYYYYINDLRPPVMVSGSDIWTDNVPTGGIDAATHQHMTTYTLGLGLEGVLEFQANYNVTPTPPGDYKNIIDGATNWPVPPAAGNNEKALDDLWHAAVNGRGKFFSARVPAQVQSGLREMIADFGGLTGAGAAAATSNLQPVAGDNWAFTAEYKSSEWHGDLTARTIDLASGIVSTRTLWSARAALDARTADSRSIFLFTTDTTNFPDKVKPFTWTNGAGFIYPTDTTLTIAEQAHVSTAALSAINGWNLLQQVVATPKTLVDFLRGDTSLERDGAGTLLQELYRDRIHILGDIVSAQPMYIKQPPFAYTDNGYLTVGAITGFAELQANRRGTVFAASNDGMLHAFDTDPDGSPYYQINGISTTTATDDTFSTGTNDGGGERWAYIPSRLLPNLWQLGRTNYTHRWFVDGSPIVEDMCVTTGSAGSGTASTASFNCPGPSAWRTIVVGGLNAGGRGFYAIDITNPASPKGLWEFNARDPSVTACAGTVGAAVGATNDCDLGLTFGNPIIAKLPLGHPQSGKWVVLLSSGYNNHPGVDGSLTSTGGDGNGYLYILDAVTGQVIEKIQTCTGSPGTLAASYADAAPCGFAKINAFHRLSDDKVNNSPIRVYGTTITGEIWRVDLTAQLSPRAHLVATLFDDQTPPVRQPITTPPELFIPKGLATMSYTNPWDAPAAIYIGSGKFLGTGDPADTQQQTLYAIKDIPGVTTTLANARLGLQSRTFSAEFNVTDSLGNTRPARDLTGGTNDAFTASNGWFADFPDDTTTLNPTGERVNVDSRIVSTTWVVPSNVPKSTGTSCSPVAGDAWLNFIDVNTGASVEGLSTTYASVKLGGTLLVGVSPIQIGDKIKTIGTTADNRQITFDTPIAGSSFVGRRIQWRELTSQ
jgi:type IV pilus assembly protein PilY1